MNPTPPAKRVAPDVETSLRDVIASGCNGERKMQEMKNEKGTWDWGLKEQEEEDIRARIEELLLKIIRQWKEKIENITLILGFTSAGHDAVRERSLECSVESKEKLCICKVQSVHLAKDFKEHWLGWEQLWPKIQQADKMAF